MKWTMSTLIQDAIASQMVQLKELIRVIVSGVNVDSSANLKNLNIKWETKVTILFQKKNRKCGDGKPQLKKIKRRKNLKLPGKRIEQESGWYR